jgi:hypothetical protein
LRVLDIRRMTETYVTDLSGHNVNVTGIISVNVTFEGIDNEEYENGTCA